MKFKKLYTNGYTPKIVYIALLMIVVLLSVTVFSKIATSPENYKETIKSIDDKKAVVMAVTATAATASTLLAAVPGDTTTPIANKIMDLSSYLLIVVCALVLEKTLLTVIGYLSFNILIPLACILLGVYVFSKKRTIRALALKLIVFALVIVLIIPLSMKISDMIYETNQTSVEQLTSELEENIEKDDSQEDKSWIDKTLGKIKDGVSDIGEKAKQILNSFIDAIAIFVIAYCVLPIIIVIFVFWFINFLFKLNIPTPKFNRKRLLSNRDDEKKKQLPKE